MAVVCALGRDIIGLAETGSGKTAAFCLPILQALLEKPSEEKVFALILTPTRYDVVTIPSPDPMLCGLNRELAFQIGEQVEALGGGMGVRSAVVVGGIDMMTQAHVLFKKPRPHVVVGKSPFCRQLLPDRYACSYAWEAGGPFGKHQGLQFA